MRLTDEEQKMLEGQNGDAVKMAMEILVAIGESVRAERMVQVQSTHLVGSAISQAGEAGMKFVQKIRQQGGRFVTKATTNPSILDSEQWQDIGISQRDHELQLALTDAYAAMGAQTCNTCTPYLETGHIPSFAEHVAWGESSAVVFINSVLGARTNREGGPSILAAALTGRTPYYGLHLKENRRGQVLIQVETDLNNMTDYGTLGIYIGKNVHNQIPVIIGLKKETSISDLKALSAALASSGNVAMFHAVGITPEANTLEEACGGMEPVQTLTFGKVEMQGIEEQLNTEKSSHVDWVQIGCPHTSFDEIQELAEKIGNRKIHQDVTFWVTTSQAVFLKADERGYISTIKESGIKVMQQTCPFMIRSLEHPPDKGYRTFTTNSAKMAYYSTGVLRLKAHYGNIDQIIDAAVSGTWR